MNQKLIPKRDEEQHGTSLRLAVFGMFAVGAIIGKFLVPKNEDPVIVDSIQNLFSGWNTWLLQEENVTYRSVIQMLSSALMDLTFVLTMLGWVVQQKSGNRFAVSFVAFYALRALVQMVWHTPFPAEGYWWERPFIPSLVVSYGRESDFFFSGHTGFLVLCLCEWNAKKNRLMTFSTGLVLAFVIPVLLIFKIHYTIDIFAGAIVAHWIFLLVDRNQKKVESTIDQVVETFEGYWYRDKRRRLQTPDQQGYSAHHVIFSEENGLV